VNLYIYVVCQLIDPSNPKCDLIHEISNPKINKLKKKIKNYIFLITQLKKLCEITVIC